MFAGDWRLAVMAYNAGEYRVLGALKRSGQDARNADPDKLPGLSGITHAYVRKLHALSCLLDQADDREEWLRALDRPVPVLSADAAGRCRAAWTAGPATWPGRGQRPPAQSRIRRRSHRPRRTRHARAGAVAGTGARWRWSQSPIADADPHAGSSDRNRSSRPAPRAPTPAHRHRVRTPSAAANRPGPSRIATALAAAATAGAQRPGPRTAVLRPGHGPEARRRRRPEVSAGNPAVHGKVAH